MTYKSKTTTVAPARGAVVQEIEIYRAGNTLIQHHGENAPIEAKAKLMLERDAQQGLSY